MKGAGEKAIGGGTHVDEDGVGGFSKRFGREKKSVRHDEVSTLGLAASCFLMPLRMARAILRW